MNIINLHIAYGTKLKTISGLPLFWACPLGPGLIVLGKVCV